MRRRRFDDCHAPSPTLSRLLSLAGRQLPLPPSLTSTPLDIFLATCAWTRIYSTWRPNLPDEADNHLVELAVAGGARFIVTRNLRDVARMELKFPELRIVSPEDFLKEIAS